MFDIGALEFVVLGIAALFIFGPERLPDVARQAARGLRKVRSMASNARRDFTKELGPEFEDLELEDLRPRNFVKKHLLSGDEMDDLDVRKDLDLKKDLRVDLGDKKRSGRSRSTNGSAATAGTDGTAGTDTSSAVATEQALDDAAVAGDEVTADTTEPVLQPVAAYVAPPPFDLEAT